VYWTNISGNTVVSAPVTGGTPTTLAAQQATPDAITVANGTLYWSSIGGHAIRSLSLTTPGAPITTVAADQDDAVGLRVTADLAFWTNDEIGGVVAQPLDGGSAYVVAPPGVNSTGVTSDAQNVYWTDTVSGTVMSAPLAGGDVTVLAAGQAQPAEIAVDSTSIYWINAAANGSVAKLAK